jgi:hypothetical protein
LVWHRSRKETVESRYVVQAFFRLLLVAVPDKFQRIINGDGVEYYSTDQASSVYEIDKFYCISADIFDIETKHENDCEHEKVQERRCVRRVFGFYTFLQYERERKKVQVG